MSMPKNDSGVKEVKVEGSSVPVTEVAYPESGANAEFLKAQDEALLHYRLTGESGVYIDPLRDQEPDIAPELGVAPHPELANPAPPAAGSGKALDVDSNPMVVPVNEKAENAKDATEAFNEALAEREEKFSALSGSDAAPAQPVYMVDAPESGKEGPGSAPGPDESPKAANANPDAKS